MVSIKDKAIVALENFSRISVTGQNAIPYANGLVILDEVIKELEKQEKQPPKEETKKDEDNIQ